MRPVVVLKNISVKFGKKTVLEDINLTIGEREIVSIVGPNGSGKTTLLRVLLGMIKPGQGEVEVLGKSSARQLQPGMIAYLPQLNVHDRAFPVNVLDVVSMGVQAVKKVGKRLTPSEKEQIFRALEKTGAIDLQNEHFGTLSGGQQQRVLIARALAVKPKLLIMDEPSTGLDAVAQDSFYQLLKELRNDEGLTILFVSHDVGTVSGIVDKIACLNRSIHFHGNPCEGIPSHALDKVFGTGVNILLHDEDCETCKDRS